MIRGLALATIAFGLLASGCGGDGSGDSTTQPAFSIPPVTSPIPATTTAPSATATQTATTGSGRGNGGTAAPNGADASKPDSATNDVPPPAGSPQEAFEKQCQQNPRACG